ncbi:lipocalin family protein [Nocardia pseudovaccinii]|uniref:lipocalin family protein n=1 Tax=Nocardia pseudovaccinii TaxID=189540 RepID=UPI003D8E69AF
MRAASSRIDSVRRSSKTVRAIAAVAVLAGALASTTATVSSAPGNTDWQPLSPIASLDVQRYLGDWNQVAAVPQPYNLDCARDTVANYQLVDPSNIRVENSCTTWTGATNRIIGNARINDPASQAQLHVSFPQVPFQNSPDGPTNYIVTYIAEDYSWALVGDPLRLSGFVLSRSPAVDAARWQEIQAVVSARGYNPCLLLTSPTSGGAAGIRALCTV